MTTVVPLPTAEAVFIDLLKVDTKKKNPCWKGYEQVGFKMKNGRRVPNCVPIKRSRKASDLAGPRKADELAKNVKDDEGHEHGADGRFASTGGKSKPARREPKNEREENLLKHVQQMAKYGKLIGMPPEHAAFYQRLADEGEWFDPKELPKEIPEGEHKMCFMNSFQNAQYRDKDYVEGIAHGIIPLHHAWNAEPGSNDAMDSTWQSHNDAESLVPTKDAAYLGIRVPHEERMKAALKHGTYGVYLKDAPPPKKKRVKKSGTPLKNVPADWKNQYEMYPNERHDPVARNRTYPLDGRQTIWPPYEMYMPTRTAGEILDAVKAVGQDRSLPDDFADYLRQRVPSFEALKSVDPSTKIDLCGKMASHDSE